MKATANIVHPKPVRTPPPKFRGATLELTPYEVYFLRRIFGNMNGDEMRKLWNKSPIDAPVCMGGVKFDEDGLVHQKIYDALGAVLRSVPNNAVLG